MLEDRFIGSGLPETVLRQRTPANSGIQRLLWPDEEEIQADKSKTRKKFKEMKNLSKKVPQLDSQKSIFLKIIGDSSISKNWWRYLHPEYTPHSRF